MNIDQARKHIVILNEGSGCIIQPMTDEYLYVLTAKHNILNKNNQITELIRFSFDNNIWNRVEISTVNLIENEHYFLHPDKDVAIVKIPPVPGFDGAYRFDNINEEKSDYYLLGYPEIRRKNQQNEWYRQDPGVQILDPRENGIFEAQIPGNVTLNEVRGESGGAILKIVGNKMYLAGIQNRMAEDDEQLGRVRFNALTSFDEIVTSHPDKLQPILPFYLKSFSFLETEVFMLQYGILTKAKCEKLTQILKAKAVSLKNSPLAPKVIRDFIKTNLPNTHISEGYENNDKKIWILWLELLTILNIAKEKAHSIADLPDIFRKVRLFYSNTNKDYWYVHLHDLLSKDYSGLDKDGIVIVASNIKADDDFHILDLSKIPESIFQAVENAHQERGMRTDIAIESPLKKYKFANISAFKEGAAQELQESFINDQLINCINTLKELYGKLIPS